MAAGSQVTLVENGVLHKVSSSRVSEPELLREGYIKTSDMQGNPVYLHNSRMMPSGPDAGHNIDGHFHESRPMHPNPSI